MFIPRAEILDRFKGMIEDGVPIVGGGGGPGRAAKWEEAGGIDHNEIGRAHH